MPAIVFSWIKASQNKNFLRHEAFTKYLHVFCLILFYYLILICGFTLIKNGKPGTNVYPILYEKIISSAIRSP